MRRNEMRFPAFRAEARVAIQNTITRADSRAVRVFDCRLGVSSWGIIRRMKPILWAIVLSLVASRAFTQSVEVSDYVRRHKGEIVREFLQLVAIPNYRADLPNMKRNAELLRQMLERRGLKPEVWETPGAPVVFGERLVPGATRTLLFYIHFDGQPVH